MLETEPAGCTFHSALNTDATKTTDLVASQKKCVFL